MSALVVLPDGDFPVVLYKEIYNIPLFVKSISQEK